MSAPVITQTQHLPDSTGDATENVPKPVSGVTSGALSTLDALSNNIGTWVQDILDRFFPPKQRQALLAKIKAFMLANPKVSVFLGMNLALTGIPLGLFTLFGLSVAVFSALGGIILGLLGAALFTLFCVGIALTVVLPVLMFTTASACFLFLFGLGGYKILQWAGGQEQSESKANGERKGITVGDGPNSLTGGRLTGLLDSAAVEREKGDIKGFSDEKTLPRQPASQKNKTQATNGIDAAAAPAGKISKRAPPLENAPGATKAVKATPLSLTAQRRRADEAKAVSAADSG